MSKYEYDVFLDIESSISECDASIQSQLVKMLGMEPVQLSCEKRKQHILYRVLSGCSRNQPLDAHVKSILSKVKSDKPIKKDGLLISNIFLQVGVFFDMNEFSCNVVFEGELYSKFFSKFPDTAIVVSCYPGDYEIDNS